MATTKNELTVSWSLENSGEESGTWQKAGAGEYTYFHSATNLTAFVYLPLEQKVFKVVSEVSRLFLPVPETLDRVGTYISENNQVKRPVLARLNLQDFEMSGSIGDKIIYNILENFGFDYKTSNFVQNQKREREESSKLASFLKSRIRTLKNQAPN